MAELEFVPFPKIPRLRRPVLITEKIDGTNACVHVPEDPLAPLIAGSRSRWISAAADNFGFAQWVVDNQELLRNLGKGTHFGEWYGHRIQRGYGIAHRAFALFNVDLEPVGPLPTTCVKVPVLYRGLLTDSAVNDFLADMRGASRAPFTNAFTNAEGIVIYHAQGRVGFKVTLKNDDAPKSVARGEQDVFLAEGR